MIRDKGNDIKKKRDNNMDNGKGRRMLQDKIRLIEKTGFVTKRNGKKTNYRKGGSYTVSANGYVGGNKGFM